MYFQIKTELITNFMKENKLSKNAFCRLCGIGTDSLNRILAGKTKSRIIIFIKIIKAMGIKLEDLIDRFDT